MRRIAICAAIILALFGLASASDARTRHAKRHYCAKVGKVALGADAQAEVYEAKGRYGREMFACAYAIGHAYALGSGPYQNSGMGVEKETLAGSTVAYEEFVVGGKYEIYTSGPTTSYWHVIVRNLRTGRVVRAEGIPGFVEGIVLKSDGVAAWIVHTSVQPEEHAIVAFDKTGTHTLASGPRIASSSLALAGSTLYWTENGRAASAVLN